MQFNTRWYIKGYMHGRWLCRHSAQAYCLGPPYGGAWRRSARAGDGWWVLDAMPPSSYEAPPGAPPAGTLFRRQLVPLLKQQQEVVPGGTPVSVLQWNVLADGLSGNAQGQGGFTLCPAEWLGWGRRRELLVQAVGELSADLVALQEVDHVDEWRADMETLGYSGELRVDERSPCLKASVADPKLPDAVALFWKQNFATLDEVLRGQDVAGADGHKSKFVMVRLKLRANGRYIVAMSSHLDSQKNSAGAAVRVRQTERLLEHLSNFANRPRKSAAAVFLCADMNAPRSEECYDVISGHMLGGSGSGRWREAYSEAGLGQEFTSFKTRTGDYKPGTVKYDVDRIFCSSHATPTAVLSLPTEQEVGPCGLPSPHWPSDHLSLYVDYVIGAPSTFDQEGEQTFENPVGGLPMDQIFDDEDAIDDVFDQDQSKKKPQKAGLFARCCGKSDQSS
jgi:nocturnin